MSAKRESERYSHIADYPCNACPCFATTQYHMSLSLSLSLTHFLLSLSRSFSLSLCSLFLSPFCLSLSVLSLFLLHSFSLSVFLVPERSAMFKQSISKLAKHSPQHRHTKKSAAQLSPASITPQSQSVTIPEQFKPQRIVLETDKKEEAHADDDEVPDKFLYLAVLLLLSLFRSLSVFLLLLMFLYFFNLLRFPLVFLLVGCSAQISRS